jgi:hypothetical protein
LDQVHKRRPEFAGQDLFKVCQTLGEWGARWLEIAPENLDPFVALWSMCHALRRDRLPDQRVVIRLDFTGFRPRERYWLLLEHREAEICKTYSGLDEDLYITADAEAFVKWHAGQLSWAEATRGSRIQLDGPSWLVRAFPTWNGRSRFAHVKPDAAAVTAKTRRPAEPLPVGARFAPTAVKAKEIKGGNQDERALLGVRSLAGQGGQSRGVHPAVEGMALTK